jgi:D-alanyl-lipoteichoic acid acyltransferase DltB (MBOAT superfamily)
VLVALYAYTLQIYCDFSGYTDFAVGSARLFGFRIPENFDRPYQALSVASYWRRWHITLSDWVRDYVYYPMGGSRGGGLAAYRNTMVTLLVLGAWHGANWTFIVYGGLHGIAVCVNRWLRKRTPAGTPAPAGWGVAWRWLVTFHFVVLARILFRSDSLAHAGQVAGALAGPAWPWPRFSHHALAVLALAYAWHFTPRAWVPWLRDRVSALPAWSQGLALAATGWACVQLGVGDSLGFIYDAF